MSSSSRSIQVSTKAFVTKTLSPLWIAASRIFESSMRNFLLLLLALYRSVGTTHLGGSCRFTPSCSEYAVKAVKQKPLGEAIILVARRILRCHPWGDHGYDPVPLNAGAHAK